MLLDFLTLPSVHGQQHLAEQRLLEDFAWRLEDVGKTLTQIGLPEPAHRSSILERARLEYNAEEQGREVARLERAYPMTAEHKIVYDFFEKAIIRNALLPAESRKSITAYTQAPAGSGKTILEKKLLCLARYHELLAAACAATTLAATSVHGATTAHALMCAPVIDDEDQDNNSTVVSFANTRPGHLEYLRALGFIAWDEFPSNHKYVFAVAQGVTDDMKGKILALFGDNQQIPPVVKSTLFRDILNATIMSHSAWPTMRVFELTGNLRVQGIRDGIAADASPEQMAAFNRQIRFVALLEALGKGAPYAASPDYDVLSEDTDRPEYAVLRFNPELVRHIANEDDAISFLYPQGIDDILSSQRSAAILCIRNEDVDNFNRKIQIMNTSSPPRTYEARNSFEDVDDPHGYIARLLTPAVLARYEANGVPPNELTLKVRTLRPALPCPALPCPALSLTFPPPSAALACYTSTQVGDICLVTKCLDRNGSLATNTRVRIVALRAHTIRVETTDANPVRHTIPRIRFKFPIPKIPSFEMTRLQFPLRLAYAVTINKSQGQSYDWVLVVLGRQCFAHGQAYVAFSRSRYCDQTAIFGCEDIEGGACVTNIVHKELLYNRIQHNTLRDQLLAHQEEEEQQQPNEDDDMAVDTDTEAQPAAECAIDLQRYNTTVQNERQRREQVRDTMQIAATALRNAQVAILPECDRDAILEATNEEDATPPPQERLDTITDLDND